MINLLPPDIKESFVYARRNSRVLHWLFALLASLVVLGGFAVAGLFYINQSIDNYNQRISDITAQLERQNLSKAQKQAQDISDSLKLLGSVLSREVLFSKLIQNIGQAMPKDARLADLSLAKDQTGVDIRAIATSYQTATQVPVNLQDQKRGLFQKADIVSVNCGSKTTDPKYPCEIAVRALFTQNSQFLFINGSAAKGSAKNE